MIDSIKTVSALVTTSGLSDISSETTTTTLGAQAAQPTEAASSFAKVMSDMATDAVDTLKLSEVKSFQGIRGEATTREVVDAVMNAEQALQTAIAIRDKVVTAYLEVARMQI
ncbi:flagellar hook-basal body complex protein FliE [Rhizobium sp. TRM95111]|uniref:flagellar hook-basal body complex protein FliE n=1 Tax=Rhizobium alarense TaxID=2846851 RepID=UPI001F2DA714|nr:flagellar hook-basal body complex protein FliE [Rhizobium alarense]MCF3639577.1 flagellar hook-basal body complex protein FliE [Rhizobium alarense]